MLRHDKRSQDHLREVIIRPNFNRYAEGSALVQFGHTHVACSASVESQVPKWLQGQDKGWISAEYGMLPRSTHERMRREKTASSGRSQEISRLIGRSLRSCVDLYKLKDVQITIDCDVLQADGGTRTAAVTGGYVALALAVHYLRQKGLVKEKPLLNLTSAVSVGILDDNCLLDLCYQEDSNADTDCNFVINNKGGLVEIQGTAEDTSFTRTQFDQMLDLAIKGCQTLHQNQATVLHEAGVDLDGVL